MYKILGNIKPQLEDYYNICKNKEYSSFFQHISFENLLLSFVPEYKLYVRNSWFESGSNCKSWHVDAGRDWTHFVIASYPSPTQIITGLTFDLISSCSEQSNDDLVNSYLENGRCQILTPEQGDVLLVSRDVIHRSNPADYHVKHLVIRCYLKEADHLGTILGIKNE